MRREKMVVELPDHVVEALALLPKDRLWSRSCRSWWPHGARPRRRAAWSRSPRVLTAILLLYAQKLARTDPS